MALGLWDIDRKGLNKMCYMGCVYENYYGECKYSVIPEDGMCKQEWYEDTEAEESYADDEILDEEETEETEETSKAGREV